MYTELGEPLDYDNFVEADTEVPKLQRFTEYGALFPLLKGRHFVSF